MSAIQPSLAEVAALVGNPAHAKVLVALLAISGNDLATFIRSPIKRLCIASGVIPFNRSARTWRGLAREMMMQSPSASISTRTPSRRPARCLPMPSLKHLISVELFAKPLRLRGTDGAYHG